MPEIIRGDASQIDDLQPLWLALREHHASVTFLAIVDLVVLPAHGWIS